MEECRAPTGLISAINQKSMNAKLFVTNCCGQWTQFNNDSDEDEENQWQLRMIDYSFSKLILIVFLPGDGKLYRVRSGRYTNLNYVIWSLILLLALVLLLVVCWIYSCITETRYERKMGKIIDADHRRNNHKFKKNHEEQSSTGQSLKLNNINNSKNANKSDNDQESFFVKNDNAEHVRNDNNKDNTNTSSVESMPNINESLISNSIKGIDEAD